MPFQTCFFFFPVFLFDFAFTDILYLDDISDLPVTEEQLKEAAILSGVLTVRDDFLKPEVRAECEHVLPDSKTIRPYECRDAYIYLKGNSQL